MFHRIILAVDLADPARPPQGPRPGAGARRRRAAANCGWSTCSRCCPRPSWNTCPPISTRSRKSARTAALDAIVAKHRPCRQSGVRRRSLGGGVYHELLREATEWRRRPHRGRLAPAGDVRLSARLERQDDRAPRAMLGAGGARMTRTRAVRERRIAASRPSGVSGTCASLEQPGDDPRRLRIVPLLGRRRVDPHAARPGATARFSQVSPDSGLWCSTEPPGAGFRAGSSTRRRRRRRDGRGR